MAKAVLGKLGAGALAVSFVLSAPLSASAATGSLEVSAWIPYWRTDAGTKDARAHISQFSEVNPFGYSVRSDGSLNDLAKLDQSAWQRLVRDARSKKVRVVPTIMWSDGNAIHNVLSDPDRREEHVEAIAEMVRDNNFDGVDIDYEGKRASTRPYYSAFLKELSAELKRGRTPKWVVCTIEARMPLSARFSGTPPANIEYANDLRQINRYCDRVRVMTYDQQTADVELNREHAREVYAPVSDVEWVEKVVNYMDNDISRSKLVIGVPTYGYVWQAMPKTSGSGFTYIKIESFNPRYGHDIAEEYDLTPERGASGELELTFVAKDEPDSLPSQSELARRAPRGTDSAYLASEGALALARATGRQAPFTYLTWSDDVAIKQKVDLAKRLGVAGVAIFKIDGGTDPDLWRTVAATAPKLTSAPKGSNTSSDDDEEVSTPEPLPPTTLFTMDLEFGMENSQVLALQQTLSATGYLTATPNGYFGPATKAALTAYQRDNGLPATGYFGPLTRALLN